MAFEKVFFVTFHILDQSLSTVFGPVQVHSIPLQGEV